MTRSISETNLKFLSILVTLVLGFGGIGFNFYKMQESMALEARRPFLEKQLEICFEATNAVAAIAANVNAPTGDEAPIDTFKRLYLGSLALVENNNVACAMTRFNRELGTTNDEKYQRIGQIPVDCPKDVPELQSASTEDVPELQPAALEVAWACRELIIKSWGAELPVDLLVDP
jgi:hypothetical protein